MEEEGGGSGLMQGWGDRMSGRIRRPALSRQAVSVKATGWLSVLAFHQEQ